MSELRWNPLLKTWTMVGSNRQNRPHLPANWCPFCPDSGKVPPDYDVHIYDNDFPILSPEPPAPDPVETDLYETMPSHGKCEVVLYSPDHRAKLSALELPHIEKLISLLAQRTEALAQDPEVQYVFPFENRGEEVGVTMPHPHGQIYAYPFVPLKLRLELEASKEHHTKHERCLLCDMNREELSVGVRVIHENEDFISYLPFFTDYPFGVFISSRRHVGSLPDLSERERRSLAEILKITTGSFDEIFQRPFPYMMVVHQTPVNSEEFADAAEYFHLHLEFYPPLRAADKIKWYASSEMGAWAAANVAAVEETADVLRRAQLDFYSKWDRARIPSQLKTDFARVFGNNDNVSVFSAPARVNLIGEHIDYNGGKVFPCALDMRIYVAARRRSDQRMIARNLNFPEVFEGDIRDDLVKTETCTWSNYLKGMVDQLGKAGHRLDTGFEMLFYSDIPTGAGVSSSAALEVVVGYALSELFAFGVDRVELAKLGQKAENEFVGVSCGIMDQFAVAMGRPEQAILLDCKTLEFDYTPLELGDYRLVITNTNKARKLEESKYNERLAECRKGLEKLRIRTPQLAELCDISADEMERRLTELSNPTIQKRVRHVVSENARVHKAARALAAGDLEEFGRMMRHSHISLRDDYEVTGQHLDTLFDLARKAPGCIGTRMTGAGFGGCTISLVHKEELDAFRDHVFTEYRAQTEIDPTFFVCSPSDGVKTEIQ